MTGTTKGTARAVKHTRGSIIRELAMSTGDVPGFDVKTVDFHTLSSAQIEHVLHWARAYGYRRPKNANGSRARYFFYLLQRHANRKPRS